MANLTYSQLKGLWLASSKGTKYHSNGWASLMAAIAMAESGGNPNALNPSDNGGTQSSYGLWQISTGTHAPPSSNWASPAENARLAIGKLNSQGLGAWGTYTSGAYKAYYSGSTSPSAAPGNPVQTTAQTGASVQEDCLWAIGGGSFLSLGSFSLGQYPSYCVLSRSQARAVLGAGLLLAGAGIMTGGLGVIALDAGLRVAGPVLGMATRTQAVGNAALRVTGVTARRQQAAAATRQQAAAERTAAREQETRRRQAEQIERRTARQAPARGRHARPAERRRGTGGRHARPATA